MEYSIKVLCPRRKNFPLIKNISQWAGLWIWCTLIRHPAACVCHAISAALQHALFTRVINDAGHHFSCDINRSKRRHYFRPQETFWSQLAVCVRLRTYDPPLRAPLIAFLSPSNILRTGSQYKIKSIYQSGFSIPIYIIGNQWTM